MPLAGAAVFLATFDAGSYRPRLERAVRQATGRTLTIGALRAKLSLWPTLIAHDVTLSNPSGFSRPDMLRISRIEGKVALLPLLGGEIRLSRLLLEQPDITLERTAGGDENWIFTAPAVAPEPAAGRTGLGMQIGGGIRIGINALAVTHGRIRWRRPAETGLVTTTLSIGRIDARAADAASPMRLSGALAIDETPIPIEGQLGPLAELQTTPFRGPWPAQFTIGGGAMTIAMTLSRASGTGLLNIGVTAGAADLALFPVVPAALRGLHDVRLSASIEAGDAGARPHDMSVHIGHSDLGPVAPGLSLTSIDLDAPDLDRPATLRAAAEMNGLQLGLSGTAGPARALAMRSAAPVAINLSMSAGAATATVAGTIARPAVAGGAALAVKAQIGDLIALEPLIPFGLPDLHAVSASAQVTTTDTGPADGIAASDVAVTTNAGDLSGRIALILNGKPRVTADVSSRTVDLDRLRGALATASGRPSVPAKPGSDQAKPAVPMTTPHVAAPNATRRVIPDTPLPFDALDRADGDVLLRVGEIKVGNGTYRELTAHAVLQSGHIDIDPISGKSTEGTFAARLAADASAEGAPRVEIAVRAPGVALAPLLVMLALPPDASGNLEVDADLAGAGASPRAIASTLTGHAGLAMVNGQIDNRLLSEVIAPALKSAKLPAEFAAGAGRGRTEVRCFAVRIDARDGIATVPAFLIDSPKLRLEGSGSANLADEALALKLRPLIRFSLTGVAVPIDVAGSFAVPTFHIDQSATADPASPAAALAGVLGGRALPELSGGDPCPPALAAARLGRQGALPAAMAPGAAAAETAAHGAPSAAPASPKPPKTIDILKQLLR